MFWLHLSVVCWKCPALAYFGGHFWTFSVSPQCSTPSHLQPASWLKEHLAVAVWEGEGAGDDDRWQWTTTTADFPFNVDDRAADNWSMHELRYGCFGVLHHRHVGSYQRCQQHSGECELLFFFFAAVVWHSFFHVDSCFKLLLTWFQEMFDFCPNQKKPKRV